MSSRCLAHTVVAALTLGLASMNATAGARPADATVVLHAKLDAEGFSQMLVPIRIKGHTFWCDADSGGSWVLSLDLTKALNAGLQPNATGTNTGAGPEVTRDQRVLGVSVEIGSVVLPNTTIVLGPRPPVAPDIDCVLGLGLLPEYAVEFDYLTPSVRLIPSAQFHPAAAAVAIPIAIDRFAIPSTRVRLRLGETESLDATLMLDTGAAYYDVVLLKPFIDANRITDRIGAVVPRVSDTAGMSIAAARGATVSVGSFDVEGPVAALITTPSGAAFNADGMIGAGFLRRFNATFNFRQRQLWLEPNGRGRGPQPFDASGIQARPTEAGRFAIVGVAADSPAAEAGLRVGDLLTEINGRRVQDMTLGEIQEAFDRADDVCTVVVERGGQLESARLSLRRRL
jgi:hypothetical protein